MSAARFISAVHTPAARLALAVLVIVGLILAPASTNAACCDMPVDPSVPVHVDACCDEPSPAAPTSDFEPCNDDGPCDCGCPRCGCVVVKAPLSRTPVSSLSPPLPASVVLVAAPQAQSHEVHLDLLRPPRV